MYLTKILLSPITNLSDARFAAAAGFDYIAFCFNQQQPEFITPIKAREIIEWTSGSNTVAMFGDQPLAQISEIAELLNMDAVLLNNDIPAEELAAIGRPIIKQLNLGSISKDEAGQLLAEYNHVADAFLLSGKADTVVEAEWLKELTSQYKIIWDLQVEPGSIRQALERFRPYAVKLSGGDEEKTGMKDFEDLYAVLDAITLEEQP